ncbi:MAG: hypothetical protein WC236_05115 [Gallionellaceae bacterium]|jgi:hypothetical protein
MNEKYQVKIYGPLDGNVDVNVIFIDGRKFSATFFTIKNIQELMANYALTGECLNGLYFWSKDMIIIESLSENQIKMTIENLMIDCEFEKVFGELKDEM